MNASQNTSQEDRQTELDLAVIIECIKAAELELLAILQSSLERKED